VAGYGRADKKQVQQMVCLLLNLPEVPRPDDAADALAVAFCHLQSLRWQKIVEKAAGTSVCHLGKRRVNGPRKGRV